MTPPTTANVLNWIEHNVYRLPQVHSIDESKGNAEGEKFQCILADSKNHNVIEILQTRKHEDIWDYLGQFRNRKQVKVVFMDMTGGYRRLMKELLPEAKLVVDKYHYVRQIGFNWKTCLGYPRSLKWHIT
ncbi:MAG: transposase [Clostridiales bacterium]|nr:transposase [Clostridiales bacterium]